MLCIDTSYLRNRKNLLAFSSGVDSSALFFLLLENSIKFDIAIVDYETRAESKREIAHAKALAHTHGITCFTATAPRFDTHFEQQARHFRYRFFEELIDKYKYDTLLTAHQLNDQMEWLLMRLVRGAGVSELVGLEPLSQREGYTLVRPLLSYSKEELLSYLHSRGHPYFVDESNHNEKYERNLFREQFSNRLLAQYKEGISRSFDYLRRDKKILEAGFETIFAAKELRIIKLHIPALKAKAADLTLKSLGYLLSAVQRQEIESRKSLVVGRKWVVEHQDDLLYISPYRTTDMPKDFKEKSRLAKIPAKIRPYLFEEGIDIDSLPIQP